MSKVIDAPADSSPAAIDINEGFAEFQAEQRELRKASAAVQDPPEVVPDSEPVAGAGDEPVKPKQEPLTDEEKSAMKRANNDRRWDKLLRESAAKDAEIERLKAEKAAKPAESATATAKKVIHPEDPDDPRPKQEDFTDFDDYVDARSTWNARQVIKAENAKAVQAAAETQARSQADTFMGSIGEYAKDHDGFMGKDGEPGAFEIVRDELEDGLQVVSAAIVESDKPAELIDYLGTHEEAFAKILAHRENPANALIALGRIIAAEFEKPAAAPATETPRKPLPKPASPVSGRGHAPTGEVALDAAAEANDFSAAQRIFRERQRRR